MQMILAPSKTMNPDTLLPDGCYAHEPFFGEQATRITEAVRALPDIAATMHVSQSIADAVKTMYMKWGSQKSPAIMMYVGDVYKGFHADTLTRDDLQWAQQHLFIMSGLYGALRPFDLISPYRLEMKAKVKVGTAKDLYEFWGHALADHVEVSANGVICVLSSDEYARPVTKFAKSRIVTPVFLDNKASGKVGAVPIYSKMMRGVMARWIIDHRIDDPADLAAFSAQGYVYNAAKSTPDYPAFYRQIPVPIRY